MKSRKQEIKVENDNTALEEIGNEFYKCKRYEVRSMLARCEQANEHIDCKILTIVCSNPLFTSFIQHIQKLAFDRTSKSITISLLFIMHILLCFLIGL